MSLADLPFPKSLPEFMKLFRTDADCGAYLELCRWPNGFVCPKCATKAEPYRFEARPGVLRCKSCKADASLTANTVTESATYEELYSGEWKHPVAAEG
jgi:hypothetical protein